MYGKKTTNHIVASETRQIFVLHLLQLEQQYYTAGETKYQMTDKRTQDNSL